jgi:predicted aspartyl protease
MTSILALTAGLAKAEPAASVDAILAANHQATGDTPPVGTIEAVYDFSGEGMTGTVTNTSDVATGDFLDITALGLVNRASAYDGRQPWMRDDSGANTSQEGGDRVQLAINAAYRNANLWWRPDHGGAAITYAGRETIDGHPADHLVVTPRGGKSFDAWFDADSHLLVRIAEVQFFLSTRTFFSDYGREGGTMQARSVVVDNGAGEQNYDTMKLRRFTVGPARPVSAYARPTAAPIGAKIDGGKASTTVPFRLLNNHVYVQGTINGHGPYTFIVDTGGHTIISPHVVKQLGLVSRGAAASTGAGEKVASNGYAKVAEIAIGGMRMRDQTAITMEVYDPSVEGIPVDGMVGFEMFRRFAVSIDYGRRTMTITDPTRFDPKGAGTPLKFKFYDHLPQVTGKVDDLPATFDIDTGSRSEVDLTSPFVGRAHLRDKYSKGVSTITGWGVGGPARSYVVRLSSLTLGGVKVDSPVASLSTAKAGSFSDSNYEGNIGSAFLKRFVTTFDYAHQTMYLKPIVPPPADAGRFDRSGLWINAGGGGYAVTYVAEGSPAAEAGLKADDVIIAIDGKPAVAAQLSDARTLLRARPAGTRVALQIKRGEERKTVELVLRDQI